MGRTATSPSPPAPRPPPSPFPARRCSTSRSTQTPKTTVPPRPASLPQEAHRVFGCVGFKAESEGFTRLPTHYDFPELADAEAYYENSAEASVQLQMRPGKYIAALFVYRRPGSREMSAAPDPCCVARLRVTSCPSGDDEACKAAAAQVQ